MRQSPSPVSSFRSPDLRPGRSCPLSYRYEPAAIARAPVLRAEALYVIGGLYGNRAALARVIERAAREPDPVALVFNGDFNWFNVDDAGFAAVNETVLGYAATRGNVETEIAGDDPSAGCGCAYPDSVGDAEVERSNDIIERLRAAARARPGLRARLRALPAMLAAEVCDVRIGIVHGDAQSLAGWRFSRESLADPEANAEIASWFVEAGVRVFACSHTCLPVLQAFDTALGPAVVANNGAAGMPNFRNARHGLVTRIARRPAPDALYGASLDGVRVEALPIDYDHGRFVHEFLANWPPGSPAHASYFRRIVDGPALSQGEALRTGSRERTGGTR